MTVNFRYGMTNIDPRFKGPDPRIFMRMHKRPSMFRPDRLIKWMLVRKVFKDLIIN